MTTLEKRRKASIDPITVRPEMRIRVLSDRDIEKILGLNFLRVFREICG